MPPPRLARAIACGNDFGSEHPDDTHKLRTIFLDFSNVVESILVPLFREWSDRSLTVSEARRRRGANHPTDADGMSHKCDARDFDYQISLFPPGIYERLPMRSNCFLSKTKVKAFG
jgi:hypothetical protein